MLRHIVLFFSLPYKQLYIILTVRVPESYSLLKKNIPLYKLLPITNVSAYTKNIYPILFFFTPSYIKI